MEQYNVSLDISSARSLPVPHQARANLVGKVTKHMGLPPLPLQAQAILMVGKRSGNVAHQTPQPTIPPLYLCNLSPASLKRSTTTTTTARAILGLDYSASNHTNQSVVVMGRPMVIVAKQDVQASKVILKVNALPTIPPLYYCAI